MMSFAEDKNGPGHCSVQAYTVIEPEALPACTITCASPLNRPRYGSLSDSWQFGSPFPILDQRAFAADPELDEVSDSRNMAAFFISFDFGWCFWLVAQRSIVAERSHGLMFCVRLIQKGESTALYVWRLALHR